jgi:putative membrane protein
MKIRHSLSALTLAALVPLGVGAWWPGVAAAQTDASASAPARLSPSDQQFVQDASQAGATEIAASKLALQRSNNPLIKQFAQQMIADHTKLARNLDVIASEKGLGAPPGADAALLGKLQTLQGADFDRAFVEQVAVGGHRKAVELFQKESQSGQNEQLKSAAAHALPVIKHHLAMAQQLAAATKAAS